MKIRPLRIAGKTIPLRDCTELEFLAYLRGGDTIAQTFVRLAWAGDLGAASRGRKPGETIEQYAHVVVEECEALGVTTIEVLHAVDAVWDDAIGQTSLIPCQEAVTALGEASSLTGDSSSTP